MLEMTRYWQRWCWKLALGSSLVGGAIASSGNFALAQISLNVTQEAESFFVIPLPQSDENVLSLESLTCQSTDAGGTNPDQISIKVNNAVVWGPYPMTDGNQDNLPPVNQRFNSYVLIELVAGSKSLGIQPVWNTGEGSLQFKPKHSTANYILKYKVFN